MKIEKVVIQGYKIYRNLDLEVKNINNVLVGDNGSGKTTLLEAINMVLNGRLNNDVIDRQITPDLFNVDLRNEYIEGIRNKSKEGIPSPPKICIEAYFDDESEYAQYKGENNTLNADTAGIQLLIEFNEVYEDEYKQRLKIEDQKNDMYLRDIPVEYYKVLRSYFCGRPVYQRVNPFKAFTVDGTRKSYANYVGKYIYSNIGNALSDDETSKIRTVYEGIRQRLRSHPILKEFNANNRKNLKLGGKDISLSVRESLPDDWLQEITVDVDSFPYDYIGFGLQKLIELDLAVANSKNKDGVLLIEEPENNLSYSNLSKLIKLIEGSTHKQKFISTHSSFVANKLGLNNLIICEKGRIAPLTQLKKDDLIYFQKLPGYNTLRIILAEKVILVEGPTDELIVNAAYRKKYDKLPIEDGIDIISVESLAFKRYPSIASLVNKHVIVVTDNDGDMEKLRKKYENYMEMSNVQFCIEKDVTLNTLEPSMVSANVKKNSFNILEKIVYDGTASPNKKDGGEASLISYMEKHKSLWGIKVFESPFEVTYPKNILDAIEAAHEE